MGAKTRFMGEPPASVQPASPALQAQRPETVLYRVKIITKPVIWDDTKNPYVTALTCPMCDGPTTTLDAAVAVTDGPHQQHVNLNDVDGKLITMRGKCNDCGAHFLLRILLHTAGTYTWHDIAVDAKTWNSLLKAESKDQLPCMCLKCQQKGTVKPDQDESTLSDKEKAIIDKCKKFIDDGIADIGVLSAKEKAILEKRKQELADEIKEKLSQAKKKKGTEGEVVDADVIEQGVANGETVPVLHEQGYALTKHQHSQIINEVTKALKVDWDQIAKEAGVPVADVLEDYVQSTEAYVRIKFATFQPKPAANPKSPPAFPAIVPRVVVERFNGSGRANLCEFLIANYAVVDQVLQRADLPASVVYNHMCAMCTVKTCEYHPTKRQET